VVTKFNTGKAQLNEKLSQGLVFPGVILVILQTVVEGHVAYSISPTFALGLLLGVLSGYTAPAAV
jgi:hypothetical protein